LNNIFSCPFCQKDTSGNHAYNCPLNPYKSQYTVAYQWSNNSINKEDEIKYRFKEINKQLERLQQEKELLEKGILVEPLINY